MLIAMNPKSLSDFFILNEDVDEIIEVLNTINFKKAN